MPYIAEYRTSYEKWEIQLTEEDTKILEWIWSNQVKAKIIKKISK